MFLNFSITQIRRQAINNNSSRLNENDEVDEDDQVRDFSTTKNNDPETSILSI